MRSNLIRLMAVLAILTSVLVGVGLVSAEAAGRNIYVASNGDDSASGGSGDPLRTINAAMRIIEPGDTVWVGGGVYDDQADEHAAVRLRTSGRPDAWMSLRAMPGERPIVHAKGHNGIQAWGPDYWLIEGFEVDGSHSQINAGAGIAWGNEAHHIRIVDNWVHDFRGGGISGVRGDYIHIEGNRVWGNSNYAPNQTSGISLYQNVAFDQAAGFHNVITGNYVYDNENLVPNPDSGAITDGNCIILDDFRHTQFDSPYPVYDEATLVTNNICFDNGGRGVHLYLVDNVHVANNTLFKNARSPAIDHGELSAIDSTNVEFVNNLVVSRSGLEPVKLWQASNVSFRSNVYVETDRSSPDPSEQFFSLSDARLANPVLDWPLLDLTPEADSPLVGSGAREPNVDVDFNGATRPAAPTPGALEPDGGSPPPTEPPTPPTTGPDGPPVTDPDGPPTTIPEEPPTTEQPPTTDKPEEPGEPPSPGDPGQPGDPARISGVVGSTSGRTPLYVADLFAANGDGSRAGYLNSVRSDGDGGYAFVIEHGCYVVVLVAPDADTFISGSRWLEAAVCVGEGQMAPGPEGTIDDDGGADGPAFIGDEVTHTDGSPAVGVVIDLFAAAADGSRADFLGDTATDAGGKYQIEVRAGCYVVVFIAPEGAVFTNGSAFDQRSLCLGGAGNLTDVDAVLAQG